MIDDPTMFARNSVRRHIILKYIFEFDNHGKIYITISDINERHIILMLFLIPQDNLFISI